MHGEGTAAIPGEGTAATRGEEPQLCMVRERRLMPGDGTAARVVRSRIGEGTRGEEPQLCMARSRSYTW